MEENFYLKFDEPVDILTRYFKFDYKKAHDKRKALRFSAEM